MLLPERIDVLVGSMLGKDYRVLKPIGVGGMAVVYLVEHQTLLKQFAAKVLSSELASSLEARARFAQEAHAASQLDHESIVSISDFGVTVDQRPFFVMELLRGQPLDQRLAGGPMTLEEVVAISVPVARALAYAHAEGIVHLDVKPENIFLVQRRHGRWGVKVVDFGIAKTPQSSGLNKPGETSGSPLFMAPEMCRGDEDIDQRADVYSFGVLLYLMLCGRLPFVDDNPHRVLEMQLVQPPPPPREINAELSPELAEVVERALAKHPDDRYPSMEVLLHELEAALPAGADRLLIEAQSGTTLRDTPFAGALSIARYDSGRITRASQPPPIATVSSSQPLVVSSAQPSAPPQRRRAPLVVAAAVASAIIAVLVVRQLATAPAAPAAHDAAPGTEAAATLPRTEVAAPLPPPAPVPPASDDRVAAPATAGERDPAPVGVASTTEVAAEPVVESPEVGGSIAIVKKPVVRPEPARPGKRVAVIAPAGTRPDTIASGPQRSKDRPLAEKIPPSGTSTTPLATAAVGSPGSQAMDANAGSGAIPTDIRRAGRPEVGGGRDATTGTPPPAIPPVKPAAPADPGSLDATPTVVSLDVKGSLSPSSVRRSVERTLASLRACYRTAARAGAATPAIDLRLTFEIDENRLATQVATSGASFGSLANCAAGVASQIRTQEAPDVGTVQVAVVIRFRPS